MNVLVKDILKSRAFEKIWSEWWESLDDNRGERAELRRADNPLEVYVSRAFQRGLAADLRNSDEFQTLSSDTVEDMLEKLALAAGVLSQAKVIVDEPSFPKLMSQTDSGAENMRDVRFRKLMSIPSDDRDALYRMLIRLIRLVGRTDVRSIVNAAYFWSDKTKLNWSREYYSSNSKKDNK